MSRRFFYISLGILALSFICLAGPREAVATVIWSDDFSDGDISDWTRGQNGQAWTVVNGELVQPDWQYPGNTVLIYQPIAWGDYVLDFDVRATAKGDALGPVLIMQSGPANPNFDWDCTLDMIDQRSPITMCAVLGQTYHIRIETIAGTARWFIDGQFIVAANYDPGYSNGFVRIETNYTAAVWDNFVLTGPAPTSAEPTTWGSVKALFQ